MAKLEFRKARDGRRWGKPWRTAWFRLRLTVPEACAGLSRIA